VINKLGSDNMRIVIATLLIGVLSVASAQMTLADEQRVADIERVRAALNNLDASLDVMIKKREADCRRAIGYTPFCGCVMKELPIAWSFADYIAITTQTKEETGYAKLTPDTKAAYDKVGPIRDRCVAKINSKK
jgi:hypothetical protein